MSECRDLEPMLAPYVDGEADPKAKATVDAHLRQCPPCRDRVSDERTARDVLLARRAGLKACASEHLRKRCEAHRTAATGAPPLGGGVRPAARRTWVPLSLVATLLLAVGSIFFFGLNQSVEVLAAQLALDHVKCFQFPPDSGSAPADPAILAKQWYTARGWPVKIPASDSANDLELLAVRRCGSTEGITAHMMYRWRGAPLSVYVLNNATTRTGGVEQFVEKVGQDAVIWSKDGRTYAVVAHARRSELEPVIKYVKVNAR
jgi:putative zinc finger protein